MFWKISWWRTKLSCRYVCWERARLKSFIFYNQVNKRQAPKTENTNSNIVKLLWIPIIGPKIRKELRKTGCKVIFTSAAKLKNILCSNKSKVLPNSYPGVNESNCDSGGQGNTLEKQNKVCWRDQLNTKKIA